MASRENGRLGAGRQSRVKRTGLRRTVMTLGIMAVAATVLVFMETTWNEPPAAVDDTASVSYAVGAPGPGAEAPDFSLASTAGGTVNLSDYRGESVLLFFHEGIGCQPCWDQIRDLDAAQTELQSAGVDQLLTITSGPVDLIAQKMTDDRLTAVALADTRLDVSVTYQTNKYGMMGESRNGHSFVLVGPTGEIEWRADYGGPPNYTMYVPVDEIVTQMQAGRTDA
ncbi:redoxin domain-containing protein [Cryobacterium breve]|uniref:Redoxin domain-containing protein n=2 Tax=Microbacteriaceae TaxID=85023 RepID=A0ABY2IYD2_9MICO|nr:redoxin domain-containing protein [Cryobacterium sp. TmT3-12]TFC97428.1 redoxin domain-containing protein [Cryobacterium breve]